MTIYRILKYPHVLLRKKSSEVKIFSEDLSVFTDNMVETMYASDGIGLAAPQVGILKKILVADVRPFLGDQTDSDWQSETIYKADGIKQNLNFPLKIVNPKIVAKGPLCDFPYDGCLSLPGSPRGVTQRHMSITLEAQTPTGQSISLETSGILSICLQHEMDHLEGVLFIDRLGRKIEDKIILEDISTHEEDLMERKRIKKLKPTDAQTQHFQFNQ